jgi:hypothetical protein
MLSGLFSGTLGLLFIIGLTFSFGFSYYIMLLSLLRAFKDEDINTVRNLNIPMKDRVISLLIKLQR